MKPPRIGTQMRLVAAYVAAHPDCSKVDVARHVNPRVFFRRNAYAYGPVDRAIAAGLIAAKQGWGGTYTLRVPRTPTQEEEETYQTARAAYLAAFDAMRPWNAVFGAAHSAAYDARVAEAEEAGQSVFSAVHSTVPTATHDAHAEAEEAGRAFEEEMKVYAVASRPYVEAIMAYRAAIVAYRAAGGVCDPSAHLRNLSPLKPLTPNPEGRGTP